MNIGDPPYKIGERVIETPEWEKSRPEPSHQPERVPEREREKVPAE